MCIRDSLKSAAGYPRISVTVPSIVIMVPGLYFYRAIYNLGILDVYKRQGRIKQGISALMLRRTHSRQLHAGASFAEMAARSFTGL